jgi:peptide/nickel transport system substrate-binding protein
VVYHFNMTYDKDPVLRDIFRDDRFRQALSLAINREEVNNVIYYGTGIPRQLTVLRSCRSFKPEYELAYAEYDVERANALLDEMGLEWDAAHEVRLRPDGKPLEVAFDFLESETPKAATTELLTDYWADVGFKITPKEVSRELLRPKIMAGEEPMGLWHADECSEILFLMRPKWFAPIAGDESVWGVPWGTWHATGGKEGQEPPPDIKDLFEWLDLYIQTDEVQYGQKILDSQAEHIWSIGVVGHCPKPIIVKNNVINVPEEGMYCWDTLFGYAYHPSQYSFKA